MSALNQSDVNTNTRHHIIPVFNCRQECFRKWYIYEIVKEKEEA